MKLVEQRKVFLAVLTAGLLILALSLYILFRGGESPDDGTGSFPTAYQIQCSLDDVGPGFIVNDTWVMSPSPVDPYKFELLIKFSQVADPDSLIVCAVLEFNSVSDRDADFETRRDETAFFDYLVEPNPPTIGNASFYARWERRREPGGPVIGVVYSVYFVKGLIGVHVVFAGPDNFANYENTRALALKILSKFPD